MNPITPSSTTIISQLNIITLIKERKTMKNKIIRDKKEKTIIENRKQET